MPLIGYRSDYVYYDRHERFAGESKYPLKKMLSFALDGITSFSVKPFEADLQPGHPHLGAEHSRPALRPGLLLCRLGRDRLDRHCLLHLAAGRPADAVPGGGGGYIGKIYSEVKARPRYRVEEYLKPREKKP